MIAPAVPDSLLCSQCGRAYGPEDLARFGTILVCGECKDVYVQKLREGVPTAPPGIYATFWNRAVAWLIDAIVLMVFGSIVQFALLGSMNVPQPQPNLTPDALGSMLGVVGLVFLLDMIAGCCYEAFFVSSNLAATPGKLALEIKVVRPDGGKIGLGRAVARYFGKRLNTLTGGIGYLLAAFDTEKRGLHDILCDTRVVRRRV